MNWDNSKQKWREFWDGLWTTDDTKWDQNGPHTAIVRSFEKLNEFGLVRDDSYHYEPGCGHAHIGAFLAGKGYRALSEDLNETAVDKATNRYQDLKYLEIKQADIFAKSDDALFDFYWDRAMMSALPSDLWKEYVSKVSQLLKDEAFYVAVLFESFNETVGGPPYAMSFETMWDLFQKDFDVFSAEIIKCEREPTFVETELVVILRRKKRVIDNV